MNVGEHGKPDNLRPEPDTCSHCGASPVVYKSADRYVDLRNTDSTAVCSACGLQPHHMIGHTHDRMQGQCHATEIVEESTDDHV